MDGLKAWNLRMLTFCSGLEFGGYPEAGSGGEEGCQQSKYPCL